MNKYVFLDNVCCLLAESVENGRYVSIPPEAAKLILEFISLHKCEWKDDFLKSLPQLSREYAKRHDIPYKKAYQFCWSHYHNGSYKTIKLKNRVFVIIEKPKETDSENTIALHETFPDILKEIELQGLIPTPLLLMKGFELSKINANAFMKWYIKQTC